MTWLVRGAGSGLTGLQSPTVTGVVVNLMVGPQRTVWGGGGEEGNSTVQYSNSTVTYDTVQYIIVRYSTVHYSTIQYSTVHYSTVYIMYVHKEKNYFEKIFSLKSIKYLGTGLMPGVLVTDTLSAL